MSYLVPLELTFNSTLTFFSNSPIFLLDLTHQLFPEFGTDSRLYQHHFQSQYHCAQDYGNSMYNLYFYNQDFYIIGLQISTPHFNIAFYLSLINLQSNRKLHIMFSTLLQNVQHLYHYYFYSCKHYLSPYS